MVVFGIRGRHPLPSLSKINYKGVYLHAREPGQLQVLEYLRENGCPLYLNQPHTNVY